MKKVLVSALSVLVTTGAIAACASGNCPCNGDSCKGKKYRVIHITANNTAPVYGEWEPVVDQPTETKSSPKQNIIVMTEPATAVTTVPASQPARRETRAYVGGRLDLNLLNMKTKYVASNPDAIDDPSFDNDTYKFEPVFGGNLSLGLIFTPSWRGDFEFGYITKFTDSDDGISLHTSTPYLLGNVMHDFANGLYVGGGIGVAIPTVGVDWSYFAAGDAERNKLSLMGALMFGYGHHLSKNLILDFRYRLAVFDGADITRVVHGFNPVWDGDDDPILDFQLKVDVKTVWDNSFSVGLRYEF